MVEQLFETEEERIEDFKNIWENYVYHDALILPKRFTEWLIDNGFFTAPASTKYHGVYEGGLYEHSRAMFYRLHTLTEDLGLKWKRPESPFIVGMFHDLCKCDQYIKVDGTQVDMGSTQLTVADGYHYEYNNNTILKGHGEKSVMLLSQFITLTEEEMLCIRYHMGAYMKEDLQEFDMAIKKYETVLYGHLADMLASKVDGT